jgi:hypothetical protein
MPYRMQCESLQAHNEQSQRHPTSSQITPRFSLKYSRQACHEPRFCLKNVADASCWTRIVGAPADTSQPNVNKAQVAALIPVALRRSIRPPTNSFLVMFENVQFTGQQQFV